MIKYNAVILLRFSFPKYEGPTKAFEEMYAEFIAKIRQIASALDVRTEDSERYSDVYSEIEDPLGCRIVLHEIRLTRDVKKWSSIHGFSLVFQGILMLYQPLLPGLEYSKFELVN